MSTKRLDGIALRNLLMSGYLNLQNNKDTINSLNVFPVPDGDTGINMAKTLEGGISAPEGADAAQYMKAFSKNSLLTARGNSGVILSQFIRGLAKGCEGYDSLSVSNFADAFNNGVSCAYSSVIKPVEGTMLTVLREAGEYLTKNCNSFSCFEECFNGLCEMTEHSLANTPELLPVLKEAGVVDSGGAGVLTILRGMEASLLGRDVQAAVTVPEIYSNDVPTDLGPDFVFDYGYCTEFIIQLLNAKCDVKAFDASVLADYLSEIGDSVAIVCDEDIVKVHVHTKTPEAAIGKAREYGELLTVKIENMSVQHSEANIVSKREKYAVVAVVKGDGLRKYFSEIGVSAFVDGGQTNNPSAEDFIKTFKSLNAEHIIVLPNNSNIILTARQAVKMYGEGDVHVIPTKSYAECYSALSMMDPTSETVEAFIEGMTSYLPYVTSGYVTVATRDVTMNGVEVKTGKYIGLDNDNVLSCNEDKIECAMGLFRNLPDIDDKGVITVFYGADTSKDEADKLKASIKKEFPDIETGFIAGGQDVYSFIFSIE
ncbi:MAG: DAK2 domain-containing protein [Clostridia bacterium]|nr:DAK2 domain-containing protein [Clostridia bacterium]